MGNKIKNKMAQESQRETDEWVGNGFDNCTTNQDMGGREHTGLKF